MSSMDTRIAQISGLSEGPNSAERQKRDFERKHSDHQPSRRGGYVHGLTCELRDEVGSTSQQLCPGIYAALMKAGTAPCKRNRGRIAIMIPTMERCQPNPTARSGRKSPSFWPASRRSFRRESGSF